jgi:hypothetical protein
MNYHYNNPYGYISPYSDGYLRTQLGIPQPKPMPLTTRLDLFPVDEGFIKGTIYRNQYRPYKHHLPRPIVPTNEREKLLLDVNKYYFALHEIRMHLDDFPNDQEAINVFKGYQDGYIKAKQAYESKFGALDIEAPNLDTSPWQWTVGTWPWDKRV